MTKWRPNQHVQTKVIGICINKARLLAMEIYDDKGDVKGVRPLGGVIEFGENREDALRREYHEELNTDISLSGSWRVFENLYVHEGMRGHEYIFAIGISLLDESIYHRDLIVFSEDSGSSCKARWFPLDHLKSGATRLFPDGLERLL